MRRPLRLGLIVAIPVAALLALDTVAWWVATSRMLQETSAWKQDRVAAGYYVASGEPVRAGWPLRAELVLPNPAVATATPGTPDALAWRAGELRLVYAPWHPMEVTVLLDGEQTVQFGAAAPLGLSVGRLGLLVPLDAAGQAGGFVGTARHLLVPLPAGTLSIDSARLKLGAQDMHASLSAVTLPVAKLPFGETIDSLDVTARATVPLPTQREPAAAAAAWRDSGGQVIVSNLELGWGKLSLRGAGQFGFDAALQPQGSGTVHVTGYGPAIEALERSGVLTRNVATVLATLLGLMSHPGPTGAPQADLPFTLRGGALLVGAIPVAKLPPLSLP